MVWSFHDTQMVRTLRYRIIALSRPPAERAQVQVRKIRIRTFRGIGFPKDTELTSRHGACQPWREKAVIVVGIHPNRTLRGIVAMICRGAPHGADLRRTPAANGAGKQHDADISGLSIDREAAVFAMTSLPSRYKAAIFGALDALEICG